MARVGLAPGPSLGANRVETSADGEGNSSPFAQGLFGRRHFAVPLDPECIVGAILIDLADEAVQPEPPHEIALRESDRIVFRRTKRGGVAILPPLFLTVQFTSASPLQMASTWPASIALTISAVPENSTTVAFGTYFANAFARRAAWDRDLDFRPVKIGERAEILAVGPAHQGQHVGEIGSVKPTDFSRSRLGVKLAIVMSAFLDYSMATRLAVSVRMNSMVTPSCFAR